MNTTPAPITTTTNGATAPAEATQPRRRARRGLLAATGMGLALSIAAPALVVAAPAAQAAPVAAEADGSSPQFTLGSSISGAFRTGDDVELHRTNVTLSNTTHADGPELPLQVGANAGGSGETRWFYGSGWGQNGEVSFTYTIGDGTYSVWGHVYVPATGANVVEAQIRRTGTNVEEQRSPYRVIARWMANDPDGGDRYDPRPEFDVYRKDTVVVTDPARQQELLRQYAADGISPVNFAMTGNLERINGPFHQVSKAVENTWDHEAEFAVEWKTTTGVEDSLGGSLKAEAKLMDWLKVEAEAHYDRTWKTEHEFGEKAMMRITGHHAGAWLYADAWDRVHGDVTVSTRDHVYVLQGVSIDFPSEYGTLRAQDLGPIQSPAGS